MFLDVLLVDLDLFSCGLRLWFEENLSKIANGDPLLTLSDVIRACESIDAKHTALHACDKNHRLPKVSDEDNRGSIYLLPCFLIRQARPNIISLCDLVHLSSASPKIWHE